MKICPKADSSWLSVMPVLGLMRSKSVLSVRGILNATPDLGVLTADETEEAAAEIVLAFRELDLDRTPCELPLMVLAFE